MDSITKQTSADQVYIFTEIVNCGTIGNITLNSFHKHHNQIVHVYGTSKDFASITPHKNNVLIEVSTRITKAYTRHGHMGTALLWAEVIKNSPTDFIIHFDSDTYFRAPLVDTLIERSDTTGLIGPRRCYKYNRNHRDDVRNLSDVTQTYCFGFNKNKISEIIKNGNMFSVIKLFISHHAYKSLIKFIGMKIYFGTNLLEQMIQGVCNPYKFSTIDFFDPVMFDMLQNKARVEFLSQEDVGGTDEFGKRTQQGVDKKIFNELDFGTKIVHFSQVGSGMHFINNPISKNSYFVSEAYRNEAIQKYAVFMKKFYNITIPQIDISSYKEIFEVEL